MSQKLINIGIQGNDGTGDSIRDSFTKVNDNFSELYAIFGGGGTIRFTNLSDTPADYGTNKIIMSSSAGGTLTARDIQGTGGITVTKDNDNVLTIGSTSTGLVGDESPTLIQSINGNGFTMVVSDPSDTLASNFATHYGIPTSIEDLVVNVGYANSHYIKAENGIVAAALNVRPEPTVADSTDPNSPQNTNGEYYDPTLTSNYLATEAMQRKDVVYRGGDTMTGPLTLSDHPDPLTGQGIINGSDDLQAATKYYVDNSTYYSNVNLYVSATKGDDLQAKTPVGREGRGWQYAYKTVGAAALQAESLINLASLEPGPYRQTISYTSGPDQYKSTIQSVTLTGGNSADTGYTRAATIIQSNKTFIQAETIAYINKKYVDVFTFNKARFAGIITDIVNGVAYDLSTGGNFNAITEASRLFNGYNDDIIGNQLSQVIDGINYARDQILNFSYSTTNLQTYIGLVIDAICYDLVFGSNYRSTQIGLYFTTANTALSTEEIIAELGLLNNAINAISAVSVSTTAIASINTSIEVIINVIRSGKLPSLSLPSTSATTKGNASARDLMLNNVSFFQSEIVAYLTANYPTIKYDVASLKNDVKFIIWSLTYDLLYGGNTQSIYTGLTFWPNGTLRIPAYEKPALLAAIGYINTLAQAVITNAMPAVLYQTSVSQYTNSTYTGGVTASSSISTNVTTIQTIVNTGVWGGSTTAPSLTGTSAILQTARTAILAQKATSTSFALTATTGNGAVATLSFAPQISAPFTIGQSIIVTGVTPSAYNGTWTVSGASVNTVSFSSTATGALTVAGNVTKSLETGAVNYVNATFPVINDLTVSSTITSLFANITSLITNGVNSRPTPTYVIPSGSSNPNIQAQSAILNNLSFVTNETVGWMGANYKVANGTYDVTSSGTTLKVNTVSGTIANGQYITGYGFTSGQYVTNVSGPVSGTYTVTLSAAPDTTPSGVIRFVSYNTLASKRDISRLAEAVAYDLTYGGNWATAKAALLFWNGDTTTLVNLNQPGTACYAAIDRLQTLLKLVTSNSTVSPLYSAGTQVQNSSYAAGASLAGTIDTLMNNVKAVISNLSAPATIPASPIGVTTVTSIIAGSTTVTITKPVLTSYASNLVTASTIILVNATGIANDTNTYLVNTYSGGYTYNETLCSRDLGLLIDGQVIDLLTGGTYQSVTAGKSFYKNASALKSISTTQRTPSMDGMVFAKALMLQVLNQTTATRYQTQYTQTTGLPVASAGAIASFSANYDIFYSIIANGIGAAPTASFGTGVYTVTFSNGGFGYVDQGQKGDNKLIPGKVFVGNTSGAYGQIVSYIPGQNNGSVNYDTVTLRLTQPGFFQNSETIDFGETVTNLNITIFVESGTYYEDYPIRLAPNVTISGDDFRRTIIRPLDRVSQSPWRKLFFYRDAVIDALQIGLINYPSLGLGGTDIAATAGANASGTTITISATSGNITGTLGSGQAAASWVGLVLTDATSDTGTAGKAVITSVSGNVLNLSVIYPFATATTYTTGNWHLYGTINYGRHYLTNPLDINSTPKNNKNIDVFLVNDANRIKLISAQGHGGFMMVLDPEGQIKTKSPYCQESASFSGSINKQRFAGGQFIDGFAGRLFGTITNVTNNGTQLTIVGSAGSGLDVRAPQTPCAFYVQGTRYQINDIVSYNSVTATVVVTIDTATPFNYPTSTVSPNYGITSSWSYVTYSNNLSNILDAISYDIVFGSNYQSIKMGLFYQQPVNLVETLARLLVTQGLSKANSLIASIGVDSAGTTSATTSVTTITNIINNGVNAAPAIVYTDPVGVTANVSNARKILTANRAFIQQEISSWISSTYNTKLLSGFSAVKSQRDTGYIVDALAYDLLYTCNMSTYDLATYYYSGVASLISGENIVCVAAFNRLAFIVNQIVQNQTVTPSAGNNATQDTTSFTAATSAEGTKIQTLISLLIDYVSDGSFNNTVVATITNTSTAVTNLSYNPNLTNGATITGSGIQVGTTIGSINFAAGTATLSQAATASSISTAGSNIDGTTLQITGAPAVTRTSPSYTNQASNLKADFTLIQNNKSGGANIQGTTVNYLQSGAGIGINIEMGGNKSMLANDFTQVNDLGYGILCTNAGLTEQVSTFTYYCYSGYWANNGGQIRSVAGSNANGTYGLRASGYDVTELPDAVTLANDMVQVARIYKQGVYLNTMTPTATTQALVIYITGYQFTPQNNCEVEIDHSAQGGTITRYLVSTVNHTIVTINGVNVLALNISTAGSNNTATSGLAKALYDGQTIIIRSGQNVKFLNIDNVKPVRPSTALQYSTNLSDIYRIIAYNLADSTGEQLAANTSVLQADSIFGYYKLVTDTGSVAAADPVRTVATGTIASGSTGSNQITVTGVTGTIALGQVIGGIGFSTQTVTNVTGGPTYTVTLSANPAIAPVGPVYFSTATQGSKIGDNKIAIFQITNQSIINQLNLQIYLIGWAGRTHRIISYTPPTFTASGLYSATSSGTTLVVTNLSGTLTNGMYVQGTGFNGQTIQTFSTQTTNNVTTATITLSGAPSGASGTITFGRAQTGYLTIDSNPWYNLGSDQTPVNALTYSSQIYQPGSTTSKIITFNIPYSSSVAYPAVDSFLTVANQGNTGYNGSYQVVGLTTSTQITVSTTTTNLSVGMIVSTVSPGAYVPSGTVIQTIDSPTQFTVSPACWVPSGTTVSAQLLATVAGIQITSPGTSYTLTPTVTFSGGGATTQAIATVTIVNGSISSYTLLSPGYGYTSTPTITLSYGNAVLTPTMTTPSTQSVTSTAGINNTQLSLLYPTDPGTNSTVSSVTSSTFTTTGSSVSGSTLTIGTVTAGTVAVGAILTGAGVASVQSIATTSASASGGTATIGFAAQSVTPFAVGQIVNINGITPTVFNGSWIVTGASTTQVQFALAGTYGPQTVAGTASSNVQTYISANLSGSGNGSTWTVATTQGVNLAVSSTAINGAVNTVAVASTTNLSAGNQITFTVPTGGSAIGNLLAPTSTAANIYYIIAVVGSSVIISTTKGGSAFTVSSGGTVSGTMNFNSSSFAYNSVNTSISSFTSKTGSGPYLVTLALTSSISIVNGAYYYVTGNANPLYNGYFPTTSSTGSASTIVLSYPLDPGTWIAGPATISREATSGSSGNLGVNKPFDTSNSVTLRAGYPAGSTGQITTRISTCRATGHDFLDIGTGGYVTSNYPNQIYGNAAIAADQTKQVKEDTVGRVFYVTSDQDGIFRVGRFFTVDQGTGTVTFSASIALSNLDGLGFKRGVVVSEFSTDGSMAENASDVVPVQAAIRTFIDRRLGLTYSGTAVATTALIGPGFMPLDGSLSMKGNLNMGGIYQISSLAMPNQVINTSIGYPSGSSATDAANRNYVDNAVLNRDSLSKLSDVTVATPANGNFLVYDNAASKWKNIAMNSTPGDVSITFTAGSPGTITTSLLSGKVFDSQINSAAAIAQSKLALNTAITMASAPTGGVVAVANLVVGKRYVIADLGTTTTQANWNVAAGTTGQTYVVGSIFTAAAVTTGNGITTENIQANSGLASFDNGIFTTNNGFVSLKNASSTSDGIGLGKLQFMASGYLLGNRSGVSAAPTTITPSQVVSDANGMLTTSFTGTGVLYQTTGTPNTYSVIGTTTASAADKIILAKSDGSVTVQQLNIGTSGYPLVTLNGTTVQFWTPGSPPTGIGSPAVITPFMSTVGTTSITTTFNGTVDVANGTLVTKTLKTNSTDPAVAGDIVGTWKVGASSTIDFYTNSATLKSGLLTTGSDTNLGSIQGNWSLTGASKLQATYADLAEFYEGDQEYEPGTVLVFGGDKEVTTTTQINDTRSAGVVTTDPAYVMNKDQTGIAVCIALAGRVPCKVVGRVKKGDMLTTSATPGYAVKALSPTLGAVIGKALEDKDYGEAGVIQVAVGRV